MRILHVITKRQLRGAEIFASQVSEKFVDAGHQVLIVALYPKGTFPAIEGVEYIDLNLDRLQRWSSYLAWKQFAAIVTRWKPDIIQANASETLKFTVISKTLFRWKPALVYRNANKVSDFIKSSASRLVNGLFVRKLDYVISVSENCRVDFIETFNVPAHKTATIPIGTIVGSVYESTRVPSSIYWINVGSLVPEKNHSGLIAIFKKYCELGGNADLIIVGDGKLKDRLVDESQISGVFERIHFLGYRQDVGSIMQHASGLLLPSLIEGLPGVILEAMASKVPVITYDVGGIPEVIKHRETGMLIQKGDEQGFVNAMNIIQHDKVVRNHVVNNAYALCAGSFNIQSIAERFLKQYGEILELSLNQS